LLKTASDSAGLFHIWWDFGAKLWAKFLEK
jgi:hypothetical protein